MSLRFKFVIYLILVHLGFAALVAVLLEEQRGWLPVVEVFFVLSLIVGIRLLRSFSR